MKRGALLTLLLALYGCVPASLLLKVCVGKFSMAWCRSAQHLIKSEAETKHKAVT